jgi:hypothetical protein
MEDGMRKEDGPVMKKLPVEADMVEYLVKLGLLPGASQLIKARGDLSLSALYYLLRGLSIQPGREDRHKRLLFGSKTFVSSGLSMGDFDNFQ